MKSRKVKAATKTKAYISKKKSKGNLPLDVSDSGSDIDSESFFHDEIDDFHKNEEDQLSTDDELIQQKVESSEEEEVLPITDDEKDDSDIDQLEKDESDDDADLPNLEAWGKRKSLYYNADFVDEDRGRTYREEDAEAAKAEADEAFAIQKSVYSNITAENLGANLFLEGSESSEEEVSKKEDIASATKQEKIKFLKKTNPEMFDLIGDFKSTMNEIPNKLPSLLSLAKDGKLPLEACIEYIKIKYQLLLHYTLNITFYMTLKASNTKVYHHPVLKRLSSYKKLLNHLKPIDDAVNDDVKVLVDKLNQSKEAMLKLSPVKDDVIKHDSIPQSVLDSAKPTEEKIRRKKSKRKNADTETEKEIMTLINDVKTEMKRRKTEEIDDQTQEDGNTAEPMKEQEGDNQMDEKRTITYQIAKNKGLAPRRKKEYRNPRVKHRMKFRKAKIRRKGQVREVVKEIKRYEGEPTGISTHVVKSIKLK